MAKLAALITSHNREDFVGICIRSIQEQVSDILEIEIYVMDNGSSDNTPDEAQKCGDNVRVFHTPDNRPLVEVINRGLKEVMNTSSCDYIILLNEDTEFRPGAIQLLIDANIKCPLSIMTPLHLNYRKPDEVDPNALRIAGTSGELAEDMLMGRPIREVYELTNIIGASIFANRETWEDLGGLDPLFWFYGCDDDFGRGALYQGYKILLVPGSHLLHAHGKLVPTDSLPNKQAKIRRWRLENHGRYMMRLKDPATPLLENYISTGLLALSDIVENIFGLWPRGIYNNITIYLHCVLVAPRIAAARRRQYDPAKKVSQD